MSTYLSIDLDYFIGLNKNDADKFRCLNLVNKALELRVPTIVVDTHHGLTNHINKMGQVHDINHLINIDFHDDIVTDGYGLNEGSWVTFINWKDNGQYEWRYPNYDRCVKQFQGVCDCNVDIFKAPVVAGWGDCIRKQGTRGIDWADIKAVGICMSGFWLFSEATMTKNFSWQAPFWRVDYPVVKKMYGDVLCKLTGKKTFDEAFWFVQSSYNYVDTVWGAIDARNFWARRLSGNRKQPWTNPPMKYLDDKNVLKNRFEKKLKRHGVSVDMSVEI